MRHEPIEESDKYLISIEDYQVTQCRVDFAFGIVLLSDQDSDSVLIRIESGFKLKIGSQDYQLDLNDRKLELLALALNVFDKRVKSATAHKTGELELKFSEDIEILVPSCKHSEAWSLESQSGLMMISVPSCEVRVIKKIK